jgi:hypothetical protein
MVSVYYVSIYIMYAAAAASPVSSLAILSQNRDQRPRQLQSSSLPSRPNCPPRHSSQPNRPLTTCRAPTGRPAATCLAPPAAQLPVTHPLAALPLASPPLAAQVPVTPPPAAPPHAAPQLAAPPLVMPQKAAPPLRVMRAQGVAAQVDFETNK